MLYCTPVHCSPFPNPYAFRWLTHSLGSLLWAPSCTAREFIKQDGPSFSHAHSIQMLLKSVKSEGICPNSGFQLQDTDVLVELLCLKAQAASFCLFPFFLPSLGSCTAFKPELWKIFEHLIWHQEENSSVDGEETIRKITFFSFFFSALKTQ